MAAKKSAYRYTLALAAIFRDEAEFLKEWIEFHRLVGLFDHFYLFDNLSQDPFRDVLEPYINEGIVDLFAWPIEHYENSDWDNLQCLAYERALHFARDQAKWLAFLDTDEFLFSVKDDSVTDTLKKYEDFGGIAVNWQVFGTSSVPRIPKNRLLIETLHLKVAEKDPINQTVKSIVRPDRTEGCPSSHYMTYRSDYYQANTDRVRFEGRIAPYVQIDTFRINHYRSRDEHFLRTKKIQRIHKWWNSQPEQAWISMYKRFNEVPDEAIFRFVPHLKQRMGLQLMNLDL